MRISDWSSDGVLFRSLLAGDPDQAGAAHQPREDREERRAHCLGEGEVGFPGRLVDAFEVIVEDTAHAAMDLAVRNIEILVRPGLETIIIAGALGIAGRLEQIGTASCRERVSPYV